MPATVLLAAVTGCGVRSTGTAIVEVDLVEPECQVDKERSALEDYQFEADFMATERFAGILTVLLQRHPVKVEETDALVMRIDLDLLLELGLLAVDEAEEQIVLAEDAVLELATTRDPDDVNVAVSLIETCPEFPTHQALTGTVSFTTFVVAEDAKDTGRDERLAGTLAATLTRANADGPVGTVRSTFDFAPPRQPLTDFK